MHAERVAKSENEAKSEGFKLKLPTLHRIVQESHLLIEFVLGNIKTTCKTLNSFSCQTTYCSFFLQKVNEPSQTRLYGTN